MDRIESEDIEIVACRVKGPNKDTEKPCEDAYSTKRFSDGRFTIAVADGLGSKSFSHVGAETATSAAVNALADYVESLDTDTPIEEDSAADALQNAFQKAFEAVQREAESRDIKVSQLGTTLLAVVGEPGAVAGAAVGDGGIVYTTKTKHESLVPPEWEIIDFPRNSMTIPLTHDERNRSYRFGFENSYQQVAVFSDGFEQHTWNLEEENNINASFFSSVTKDITESSSSEEASKLLGNAFTNKNFRKFSDDKTLAIARLQNNEWPLPLEKTNNSSCSDSSESKQHEEDIKVRGEHIKYSYLSQTER